MKVVFLDFDGVLNANTTEVDDSKEFWSAEWLEPPLVARLAQLVERSGARVVVSSSWRQRRSREDLEQMLAHRGYSGGVLDVTPRLARPPEGELFVRASEISAWLATHPEVMAFAILDDDAEFGALAARHVHVDAAVGLTDSNVARAFELLACADAAIDR